PGCARSMCGSQVVVVRAVWLIRAGIPPLVPDLVEILTHLVAAPLLAHGLGPSSHALRIVFVDVPESGAIADLLQPAVFGEDLGGTRDQPGQAPTAAIRTLWRRFDGRQAAKENRGPLAAVRAAILVNGHRSPGSGQRAGCQDAACDPGTGRKPGTPGR